MFVTINYKDHLLEVEGDYSPEEPMVMYYSDGSGYPGCSASFEVHDIMLGEYSLYEILSNDIEIIEELVINKIQDYDE
jgi:hypothetical protein